jgi:signal recognition particle receptor subunit alpha
MLDANNAANGKRQVELFERGYGKDAAGIAKEAIAYGGVYVLFFLPSCADIVKSAKENDFDVVLIDTAGRMQDNEVRDITSPSQAPS